jgi:hypothetical protein
MPVQIDRNGDTKGNTVLPRQADFDRRWTE